jgi:thiol-disulfide isomerase/thioredoxin
MASFNLNYRKTHKNIRHSKNDGSNRSTRSNRSPVHKNTVVVGKIYANWCGHCTALKPKWEEMKTIIKRDLAKYLKNVHVEFTEIEQTDERSKVDKINKTWLSKSNEKLSASGYPTLFKIYNNQLEYYNDEREPSTMAKWFINNKKKRIIGGRSKRSRRTRNRLPQK